MDARRHSYDVRRHSYSCPKSLHLRSPKNFDAVYAARTRQAQGPLMIYARPNGLGHNRLGFSISRRVGIAVRRNRIRRLLREAFRLAQHELPRGYDLVIVVRAHEPLKLPDYLSLLGESVERLHQIWQKRQGRDAHPQPNAKIGGPWP